ncbi:MAG: hypothetical protein ACETWM_08910 [Candidatus Lokiarchaeia archaeon]
MTDTVPLVAGEMHWITRTVVVLPAPFGPSIPRHSPRWTVKEMPATAVSPLNFLTRSLTSIIVFMFIILPNTIHGCKKKDI